MTGFQKRFQHDDYQLDKYQNVFTGWECYILIFVFFGDSIFQFQNQYLTFMIDHCTLFFIKTCTLVEPPVFLKNQAIKQLDFLAWLMAWLIFNDFHIKFRAKLYNNRDEDVEPT